MTAALASKSSNPFQSNRWNHYDQFASSSSSSSSSSITNYYETDILHNEAPPTFRSISPKIYHQQQQKKDYFSEMSEELEFGDDGDSLYEATLLNSHFLESLQEQEKKEKPTNNTKPIDRLYQLLGHISPNYQTAAVVKPSALSNILALSSPPSVRSQFSAAVSASSNSPQQAQTTVPNNTMVPVFMSDFPRDLKGKGKLKPTL